MPPFSGETPHTWPAAQSVALEQVQMPAALHLDVGVGQSAFVVHCFGTTYSIWVGQVVALRFQLQVGCVPQSLAQPGLPHHGV